MPGPPKGKGGRPRTPTETKRRRGTDRPDRTPRSTDLAAVAPVDADAVELSPLAALERSLLAGKHWLAESDAASIVLARDALELYAELRADPKAKASDVISAGKWVQSCFSDLGFTPGERSRLGLAEVKAVSKMEALRAQRAKVADTGS